MFVADEHNCESLIIMGSNTRLSNRGKNATETLRTLQKDENRKLTVVDPRITETTRGADRHLRLKPGTDAYMLLGIAATIVNRDLVDHAYIKQYVSGYEKLRDLLANVDVDDMARRCGLTTQEIVETATEFATAKTAAIAYDLGVEQTWFSTLVSYMIRAILTITGNAGKVGGDLFLEIFQPPLRNPKRFDDPPRAVASGLPGIRALSDYYMLSPNLVPEEIEADHPQRLRAAFVENANPWLSYSDTSRWTEARKKLDLLVVLEPAMSETAQQADYVLPVPTGYEKWEFSDFPKGYPEIFVHLRPPVLPREGNIRAESEVYPAIAKAMGVFGDPPQELAALAAGAMQPEGAGLFLTTAQQKNYGAG